MRVHDAGSIVVIETETTDETEWILENVSAEGFNPDYPERINVEARYAGALLWGAQADGIKLITGEGLALAVERAE